VDLEELARLRHAHDLLDREYARPLEVPAMARAALMSPAHFSRRFREAYGETPYGYLQTRRVGPQRQPPAPQPAADQPVVTRDASDHVHWDGIEAGRVGHAGPDSA